MLTIDETLAAAWELVGDAPDIRLALIASILSPQKNVHDNSAQLACLRDWVRDGFPTRSPAEVYARVSQYGMVSDKQCWAILAVMGSAERGELDHLKVQPSNGREWLAWRREVAQMYCLSWKTASFAALIMWPLECPFVPVDSHVCARFGLMKLYHSGKLSAKTGPGYKAYRQVERRVYAEKIAAGYPTLGTSVWHWYMWENWRQASGDSRAVSGAETHSGLRAW